MPTKETIISLQVNLGLSSHVNFWGPLPAGWGCIVRRDISCPAGRKCELEEEPWFSQTAKLGLVVHLLCQRREDLLVRSPGPHIQLWDTHFFLPGLYHVMGLRNAISSLILFQILFIFYKFAALTYNYLSDAGLDFLSLQGFV